MRNLMTRKTCEQLTRTLQTLREVELPMISKEKLAAAEQGDLRENAGYEAARERMEQIHHRINDLEGQLSGVEFIEDMPITGEMVTVGTVVTVAFDDRTETYTILGPADSDPAKGVISFLSPLARGLIGKVPGAALEIDLPSGRTRVRVETIEVYKPS